MIVNAFVVYDLNTKFAYARASIWCHGNVSSHILDEHRVVVCLHRDVPLIWTLEYGVERS